MKAAFPDLWLGINGGITSLNQAKGLLDQGIDEVMIGRAAYQTPGDILLEADAELFGQQATDQTRVDVVKRMLPYIADHVARGGRLNHITRHMVGLFAGMPGARQWRRILSERAHIDGSGAALVEEALACVVRPAKEKAAAA